MVNVLSWDDGANIVVTFSYYNADDSNKLLLLVPSRPLRLLIPKSPEKLALRFAVTLISSATASLKFCAYSLVPLLCFVVVIPPSWEIEAVVQVTSVGGYSLTKL